MRRRAREAALRRAASLQRTSASAVGCLMAAALALGCTSAGGVSRDDVQVRVSDSQGSTTGPICTELPVLWGARVEGELAVEDVLIVRVSATPRAVELTVSGEGLSTDQLYDISLEELRNDDVADIPIVTSEDAYTISVRPGCSG